MRSFTTLTLARAMEEELRRQARPHRRDEPTQATKATKGTRATKPGARSWAMILSFPRLHPSKG
jgi:hypothetical protein